MAKLKNKPYLYFVKQDLLPIVLFLLLFILIAITYQAILADKYYPLTFVGNINISFLTEGQAIRKVESSFRKRSQQKLQFYLAQDSFAIDLATTSAGLNYSALSENLKASHRSPFIFFLSTKINLKITINLNKQLDMIASAVDKTPQNATLIFDETPSPEDSSYRIQIKDSQNGVTLDKEAIEKEIENFLLYGKYQPVLPTKVVSPKVTTNHLIKAKQALDGLQKVPIKLVLKENSWTIDTKQLLMLLDLEEGQGLLDKTKTDIFLEKIASEINQEVQEGLFEFNPITKRVTAFKPSQEGQKLDVDRAYQAISDALASQVFDSEGGTLRTQTRRGDALEPKTISLPVNIVKPKIETSDVNSLGIKELIGRGISNFAGSIPNRIYNISLTASKINGVLILPGQIFSFNQTVGDITAATGFKQAYVIKEGRTVLDDGGGVCQDSTTLFRAVLNAGLPVLARTAHAYRVGYYEQGFPPGLDATVFYPSVDFKFKNDTSAHILIQAYTAGNTLYVDLYGTPDGRTVNLTKPIVTDQTPPPPDLRQDDPTLPRGTVKQVDWSAWGANVSFKRTVIRNGETIINETWKSSFKPWQAVYLVGTKEN